MNQAVGFDPVVTQSANSPRFIQVMAAVARPPLRGICRRRR